MTGKTDLYIFNAKLKQNYPKEWNSKQKSVEQAIFLIHLWENEDMVWNFWANWIEVFLYS